MKAIPRLPVTRGWGVTLAFGTALISGVAIWVNATALGTVGDPAVFTTLKNLVAAAILIGAAGAMGEGAQVRALSRQNWTRLVVVGVIGGSVPFLLFFTGLSLATAPAAAFIHKTLFLWVALMAVPFLGERIGIVQIGALSVLLVGQMLLVAPTAGGSIGVGEVMILAATLLWSIEVIVAKRLLADISPAIVGSARLGFGVLLLMGYLVVTGKFVVLSTMTLSAAAWLLVTGVLLAAYTGTWLAALRRAPASVVTATLVVGAIVTASLDGLAGDLDLPTGALLGLVAIGGAAILMAASAGRIASHNEKARRLRTVPPELEADA
jgi:drug/metabolite transporter (DMT)-like permease